MLEKTTTYAIKTHQAVNHKYGEKGYEYHLQMVHEVAEKFIYLVAEEERENVLCACWVHDIIEDARETYNDVKKNTNETVAELAFALTNEKGKTEMKGPMINITRKCKKCPMLFLSNIVTGSPILCIQKNRAPVCL